PVAEPNSVAAWNTWLDTEDGEAARHLGGVAGRAPLRWRSRDAAPDAGGARAGARQGARPVGPRGGRDAARRGLRRGDDRLRRVRSRRRTRRLLRHFGRPPWLLP